eukprot:763452-Hanusia_phi.AAC.2
MLSEQDMSKIYLVSQQSTETSFSWIQNLTSHGDRAWTSLKFPSTSSTSSSPYLALASMDSDVKIFQWTNVSELQSSNLINISSFSNISSEILVETAQIANTSGIADVAGFMIGSQSFLAVCSFFDQESMSYNMTSKIFQVAVAENVAIQASSFTLFQTFSTNACRKIVYHEMTTSNADMKFFAFLDESETISVYSWNEEANRFEAFQQFETRTTRSMLTFFSVSSAATNHYLLVSESQSCTTELSDLQGNCSMMYTWNGTFFVDFPSIDWPLSSTGGQELPAADAHVLFQDQNNQQKPAILLSYTFAQDKPRTPFQETGPRFVRRERRGEERRGEERRGEERRGEERRGEERSEESGAERRGEGRRGEDRIGARGAEQRGEGRGGGGAD